MLTAITRIVIALVFLIAAFTSKAEDGENVMSMIAKTVTTMLALLLIVSLAIPEHGPAAKVMLPAIVLLAITSVVLIFTVRVRGSRRL